MKYLNTTRQHTGFSLGSIIFATLLSNPSFGAPVCIQPNSDQDNDGWGWENNQSCVVDTRTPITPTLVTPVVNTGNATPVCSSASIDSDNDGWGWENNRSCIVAETNTSPTPTVSTPSVTSNTTSTPQCLTASSDHDNDGWGWENGQSCKVATTITVSPVAAPSPVSPVTPVSSTPTGTPICQNASSDHDNDGWGWENNASCIATAVSTPTPIAQPTPGTTPNCSLLVNDDNNDGWGWENNHSCKVATVTQPLKIMAVGDSITHGVLGQSSYRKPLNAQLTQYGCDYEFVGSQNSNLQHNGFIAAHESYSGHTTDHFLTGRNDSAGSNSGIANSMQNYNPDIVMLHIGSNDMRLGQNIDNTLAEIDQIISIIHQQNSAAVIFVANLVPWYQSNIQSAVATLGDKIEAYIAQLSNPMVRLVDVRSGYTSSMMIYDQIHPNASGDAHIAAAYFNAYNSAGLCKN